MEDRREAGYVITNGNPTGTESKTENKVKKRSKTAEKAKSRIHNLQKMQNYGIIELGRAKKEWMYYFKTTHKILHKRELQTF